MVFKAFSSLRYLLQKIGGSAGEVSQPADHAHNLSQNGRTSIVTVVVVWAYSIGVTIVIAIVYFLLNRIRWLDELGRAKRSHADSQTENILVHLSKVAILHEKDEDGLGRYSLVPRATEAEEDD